MGKGVTEEGGGGVSTEDVAGIVGPAIAGAEGVDRGCGWAGKVREGGTTVRGGRGVSWLMDDTDSIMQALSAPAESVSEGRPPAASTNSCSPSARSHRHSKGGRWSEHRRPAGGRSQTASRGRRMWREIVTGEVDSWT